MNGWLETFLLAWIPLFVVMDALGMVPVFLGMTQGVDAARRRHSIDLATLTAGIVAISFMFLGRWVFRVLGITVADFQIAGGLILLVLAMRDMVGENGKVAPLGEDFGVVPLGLPLIVGPATLTALLSLQDTVGMPFTLAAFFSNLALVWLALRYSDQCTRLVGATALRAFGKIISLLLAAIAVNMIRHGWQEIPIPSGVF